MMPRSCYLYLHRSPSYARKRDLISVSGEGKNLVLETTVNTGEINIKCGLSQVNYDPCIAAVTLSNHNLKPPFLSGIHPSNLPSILNIYNISHFGLCDFKTLIAFSNPRRRSLCCAFREYTLELFRSFSNNDTASWLPMRL